MILTLTFVQLLALVGASISMTVATFFWLLGSAANRPGDPAGCLGYGIAIVATTVCVGLLALLMAGG